MTFWTPYKVTMLYVLITLGIIAFVAWLYYPKEVFLAFVSIVMALGIFGAIVVYVTLFARLYTWAERRERREKTLNTQTAPLVDGESEK